MLIKDQGPMTALVNDKSTTTKSIKRRSSFVETSTRLCRRISGSIKRNLHDTLQSSKESRREKRPQDGRTNPME